ncbi:unnamed protein product [marine sediment metagenome]|uniref:Uncharacterized protein n=1 Tax=marine sediment metagenome TaxID=412755 RepID=X0ZLI4_9ZZZZ
MSKKPKPQRQGKYTYRVTLENGRVVITTASNPSQAQANVAREHSQRIARVD